MRFRSRQGGIATVELAASAVLFSLLSIMAFGAIDTCSKTFTLRRITEESLAAHSNTTLKAKIGLTGDVTIVVDEDDTQKIIDAELLEAGQRVGHSFPDLQSDDQEFRVDAKIRVARIDANTGAFQGYDVAAFEGSLGNLSVPSEIESKFSLDDAFDSISADVTPDGVSFLAEPSPNSGSANGSSDYLPKAIVSALRIFVRGKDTPMQFLKLDSRGDMYLGDRKIVILRGGLR